VKKAGACPGFFVDQKNGIQLKAYNVRAVAQIAEYLAKATKSPNLSFLFTLSPQTIFWSLQKLILTGSGTAQILLQGGNMLSPLASSLFPRLLFRLSLFECSLALGNNSAKLSRRPPLWD
jgi:hypothetical protein